MSRFPRTLISRAGEKACSRNGFNREVKGPAPEMILIGGRSGDRAGKGAGLVRCLCRHNPAILLAALFALVAAAPAWAAEEAIILTIRPEQLNSRQAADTAGAGFGLRDPFNWPADRLVKPEAVKVEEIDYFADLTLTGIIWSTEKPLAIVNEKLVGRGDKVDGVTVKDIHKESVVLTHGSKSRTMRLLPPLPEAGGETKGGE